MLFSGALPFNWEDNDKPGLLSRKFVMRLQFCQHVPPLALSPYSSTSEFMPHIYSDSCQQGILGGVRLVPRGHVKILEERGELSKTRS